MSLQNAAFVKIQVHLHRYIINGDEIYKPNAEEQFYTEGAFSTANGVSTGIEPLFLI